MFISWHYSFKVCFVQCCMSTGTGSCCTKRQPKILKSISGHSKAMLIFISWHYPFKVWCVQGCMTRGTGCCCTKKTAKKFWKPSADILHCWFFISWHYPSKVYCVQGCMTRGTVCCCSSAPSLLASCTRSGSAWRDQGTDTVTLEFKGTVPQLMLRDVGSQYCILFKFISLRYIFSSNNPRAIGYEWPNQFNFLGIRNKPKLISTTTYEDTNCLNKYPGKQCSRSRSREPFIIKQKL